MPTCHRHTTVLLFLTIENDRSSILVLAAKFKEEVRNNTAANVRVSEGLGKESSLEVAPRALRYWLDFYYFDHMPLRLLKRRAAHVGILAPGTHRCLMTGQTELLSPLHHACLLYQYRSLLAQ